MIKIFQRRQLCSWLLVAGLSLFPTAQGWSYAAVKIDQSSELSEEQERFETDMILQTAIEGGREAQFQLGTLYDEGGELDLDYEMAAFWYDQAARQNHHQAQFRLGNLYYIGVIGARVPDPDYDRACPLFEQAANQNVAQAMLYLGSCALLSQHNPDWSRARYWFEKAARQGLPQAQFLLGQFYEDGQGEIKNSQKAIQFYLAAASEGHGEAAFKLGRLLEMQTTPDYNQAGLWYKQAAMLGYSHAFLPLARLYYQGLGLPQDYGQAYRWFEKAARLGDETAAFNLGFMLSQGQGRMRDDHKARFWYGQAAQKGKAAAQYNLAVLYEEGRGGEHDLVQALHFYQMAAQKGDVDALVKIGFFYEKGLGVMTDTSRALSYYQRAAAMGDAMMQYYLGMFYSHPHETYHSDPDYSKAKFWLEKAAAQGHVQAESQLTKLEKHYFEDKKAAK